MENLIFERFIRIVGEIWRILILIILSGPVLPLLTRHEVLGAVDIHVGHGSIPVGLAREVVLLGNVTGDGHGLADDLAVDLQDGQLVERDA